MNRASLRKELLDLEVNLPLLTSLKLDLPPYAQYGVLRKHDIHTGIDLHCPEGSNVFTMFPGTVVEIGQFTGASVQSPWWKDTHYVVIYTAEIGYILYGEIKPRLDMNLGDVLEAGDYIGKVVPVLKKDKGLPTSMLHLEWYNKYSRGPVEWSLGDTAPEELNDVTIVYEEVYFKYFGTNEQR